jgi:hypothetical protein
MDPRNLSEADKHLIYGLLLKKKRSGRQERKVLGIVRSSLELEAKIEAILRVTRAHMPDQPGAFSQHEEGRDAARPPRRKARRENVVVVDARAEIAGLLKKSSLKRRLSFSRVSERYDAVPLISALHARLVIVNELLAWEEEYSRYFEVCRAVHHGVRVIFLGKPPFEVGGGPGFGEGTRFLAKPLSFEKLEESAKELLQRQGSCVER